MRDRMTENKRYEFDVMNGGGYVVGYSERMSDDISFFTRLCEVPTKTQAEKVCNELKGLQKENERLKRINKGQELEIVRLHKLADAMSGVLRELGIYNVYDDETIEEIKNKIKGDVE